MESQRENTMENDIETGRIWEFMRSVHVPKNWVLGIWKVVQVLRKSIMIVYLDRSGLKGFGQLRVRV